MSGVRYASMGVVLVTSLLLPGAGCVLTLSFTLFPPTLPAVCFGPYIVE